MLDAIRHPAVIFLVLAGLWWLRHKLLRTRDAWPARSIRVATIGLSGIYLGMQLVYLFKPGYWDPIEPSVTAVAQQLQQGRQIYHALDAAPRFSLLYGPAVYITNTFFLWLSNNPIEGSKLSGVVWGTTALLIFGLIARRSFDGRIAMASLGGLTACALWFEHYTYWNRADSLLYVCSCLGLFGAVSQRGVVRGLALSIAIGVAISTKLHAFLYFLPLLALVWVRYGLRSCLLPVGLSLVWASLPFVLFPAQISLAGYAGWLMASTIHPLSLQLPIRNLEYAFLLSIPLALQMLITLAGRSITVRTLRRLVPGVVCLFFTVIICVIGSKVGAGQHHLIPFIPVMAYLTADLYVRSRDQAGVSAGCSTLTTMARSVLIPAWILAAGAMVIIGQIQIGFYNFIFPDDGAIQSDLLALKAKYAAYTVQMGYGGDAGHRATYYRPWLYQGETEYVLDSMALMDMQVAGVRLPAATLAMFSTGQFDIWLIPRAERPFSMHNSAYLPHELLFGNELLEIFAANYIKVDSSQFYDVWQARRLASSGDSSLDLAARQFGTHWVVLDANRPAGLAELYANLANDPHFSPGALIDGAQVLEVIAP